MLIIVHMKTSPFHFCNGVLLFAVWSQYDAYIFLVNLKNVLKDHIEHVRFINKVGHIDFH